MMVAQGQLGRLKGRRTLIHSQSTKEDAESERKTYLIATPIGIMEAVMSGPRLLRLDFLGKSSCEEASSKLHAPCQDVLPLDSIPCEYNPSLASLGITEEAHTLLVQLKEYFSGKRHTFSVPLSLEGPVFYQRIWEEMWKIPYGQVRTYSQLAEAAGSPKAARAAGTACAQNPIAVIVPCHRVVAKSGLGGYGGGLEAKKHLLALEQRNLDGPR